MLSADGGCDWHEKFRELCALAHSGSLAPLESSELQSHLQHCEECRGVYREYRVLSTQGKSLIFYAFDFDRQAKVGQQFSGLGAAGSAARRAGIAHEPWHTLYGQRGKSPLGDAD